MNTLKTDFASQMQEVFCLQSKKQKEEEEDQ